VNPLIARMKARVADPLRAVDAAAWVEPMPRIAPPATVEELHAAEKQRAASGAASTSLSEKGGRHVEDSEPVLFPEEALNTQ
jgi:hypothetical protein